MTWADGTSIQIDAALGVDVAAAALDQLLVSFLYLVRFDGDLSLDYLTDAAARADLVFRAVPSESPTVAVMTTTTSTT
jgi:hypothetical protein